jgi:hypothetical protein
VFNYVNLHVYHYAANNPVKYVDPDGEKVTLRQFLGLFKSIGNIFTIEMKIGLGVDLSAIVPFKIDILSRVARLSFKNGYEEKATTGISTGIIGVTRTAPDIRGLSAFDMLELYGDYDINVGFVVFNEDGSADVEFSFGGQVVFGIKLILSGKEILNLLSEIGELQNALRGE